MVTQGYRATLVAATLAISRSSLYYRKRPRGSRADRTYDEQIVVAQPWELPQDLRQGLLAELGGSTGAGGKRREFKDLLSAQKKHPPSDFRFSIYENRRAAEILRRVNRKSAWRSGHSP